jgi:hypothetical protein
MAIHDAYARFTPYELSIPGRDFADEHFPRIADEGEARDSDLSDPDAFVMLSAAGAALREIRGEEDDPALIEQYGALLFHGFHFWRSGEPLYLLETGVARYLVESEPDAAGWTPSVPSAGGYVQLPWHLFWAHSEDESPPEPLDGFFWTRTPDGTLTLLAAMGMREDRPGLGVIPLPPLPMEEVGEWISERARDPEWDAGDAGDERGADGETDSAGEAAGADFRSLLPGGEIDRLYSVVTAGEIVKLAALVLWYLEAFGDAVGPEERTARDPGSDGPLASALTFRRVRLGDGP